MSTVPIIVAAAPAAGPQAAAADPRAQDLVEALASLHGQTKDIRTPAALASDLLAEALLQRRYGQTMPDAASPAQAAPIPAGMAPGRALTPGGAPAYAPQGQPGPLQVAPAPRAGPSPSPSPGAFPPSAPGGTASAAPAAAAAGAAMAPGYAGRAFVDQRVGPQPQLPGVAGGAPAALAPPPPGVLNEARAALRRGADPARIWVRLVAHGFDPRAL